MADFDDITDDDLVASFQEDSFDRTLRGSMLQGMENNPDQAAALIPLAKAAKVPLDMAGRNKDKLQKQIDFQALDFDTLQKDYPKLADYFANPENAAVSHDDMDALQKLNMWSDEMSMYGGALPWAGKKVADNAKPLLAGALRVPGGALAGLGETAYRAGEKLYNAGSTIRDDLPLEKFLTMGAAGVLGAVGAPMKMAGDNFKAAANEISPMSGDFWESVTDALGQVSAQIGITMATGGANLPVLIGQGLDQGFEAAKKYGLDGTGKGDLLTLAYGAVTGLTEKYGLEALMKGVPASAKAALGSWLGESLKKMGMAADGAAAKYGAKAIDTAYRGLTEALQEGSEKVGQNIADIAAGQDKKVFDEVAPNAEVGGTVGAIVGAIMNTFTKTHIDFQTNLENVKRDALKEGRKVVAGTKTYGRVAANVNGLLRSMNGNSDIWINPLPVQTFYQTLSPEEQAALNAAIPDFESMLTDAMTAGTDMQLNQADYVTAIQSMKGSEKLDDFVRWAPEHLSPGDREEYSAMMDEIMGAVDALHGEAKKGTEEGAAIEDNIYNQLLQKFGQRTRPSGNVDVARLLSQNPRAFYETILHRSGNDERVKGVLDRLIRGITIQRHLPEVENTLRKTDFDLYIDRVRNLQNKAAEQAAKPATYRTNKKGQKVLNKGRDMSPKAPTPVMDYIASLGGIRRDSIVAGELKSMGLKIGHKVFNKKTPPVAGQASMLGPVEDTGQYGLGDIDTFVGSEFEDATGIHPKMNEDGGNQIDRAWLLEQLSEEAADRGQENQEQADASAEMAAMDDLLQALDYEGVDINTATNAQIKAALERYSARYAMKQGETFEQKVDTKSEAFKKWFGKSKVVDDKGAPLVVYSGSPRAFDTFDMKYLGENGYSEGKGFYFTDKKEVAQGYAGDKAKGGHLFEVYLSIQKPMTLKQRKITDAQLKKVFKRLVEIAGEDAVSNYGDPGHEGIEAVIDAAVKMESQNDTDVDLIASLGNSGVAANQVINDVFTEVTGYDGVINRGFDMGKSAKNEDTPDVDFDVIVAFNPTQIKSINNRGTFDPKNPNIFFQTANQNVGADHLRSVLVEAAGNLKQEKGTGEQMLAALRNTAGVKEEEIAWTGLDEFLKGKKTATKAEIVKFLDENQVRIEEVTLGEDGNSVEQYRVIREDGVSDGIYASRSQAMARAGDIGGTVEEADPVSLDNTEYSTYQLPGGENYREVLLTLPESPGEDGFDVVTKKGDIVGFFKTREEADDWAASRNRQVRGIGASVRERTRPNKNDFRSGHFKGRPNILAHIRLNDRVDADGKKVLFIEEIQSDWHQAGRKKGYRSEDTAPAVVERSPNYFILQDTEGKRIELPGGSVAWTTKEAAENAAKEYAKNSGKPGSVPDAPFKKSWQEVAMRRVLQMAATQGYDRVAWTTGEQQNERYDLSKQVEKVMYWAMPDGKYGFSAFKVGNTGSVPDIKKNHLTEAELEDNLGKDLTQKIVNREHKTDMVGDTQYGEIAGLDLKVGGEGMKGFYDKILPSYAKKFGKKFGAAVIETKIGTTPDTEAPRLSTSPDGSAFVEYEGAGRDFDTLEEAKAYRDELNAKRNGATAVHAIDITPAMRESAAKGFELFQTGAGDEHRGSITFTPDGKAIINIFEKEDLSTVLHEFGHLYWKVMTEIAALPDAPAQIVKDVSTMRTWVGAKGSETLTVPQEEQIADGFLAFLRTGDAPSADLQTAFSRFKGWLGRIYKGVRDTLPTISPEVAEVFNRMLATDEAIEEIENTPEFGPDPVIRNMLTKAQAEKYDRDHEKFLRETKDRLFRRALKQQEKKATKEYREEYDRIHAEVTKAAANERRYSAVDAILAGGGMDRKAVVKVSGKEILPYLAGHGGLVKSGGKVDPAEVAALAGYSDARAMLDDFMNMEKRKDYIERLTNDRMVEMHGDMLEDGTLEREALQTYHNDLRAEMKAYELKVLADKAGIPAPTNEAIKAKAIKMIYDRSMREMVPYRYYRAELKAERAAGLAIGRGDMVKAAVAKAQSLLNHHLYRESLQAREDMDKILESWRRIVNKKDEKIGKGINIDYVYAARAIMSKYGVGRPGQDFGQWYKALLDYDPNNAEKLMTAYHQASQEAKPYKWLPYGEFLAVNDAVKNLIETGRADNKVTKDGEAVDRDDAVFELENKVAPLKGSNIPTGPSAKPNRRQQAKKIAYALDTLIIQVEALCKQLDGGVVGPFHDYIWNPVMDGINKSRIGATDKLREVHDALLPLADGLTGEPIAAPELVDDKGDIYNFENLGEVMGMMVHLGNGFDPGSNGHKLLEGYGWSHDSLMDFLERLAREGKLTEAHLTTLQQLWDITQSMKTGIWNAHRAMYGVYPSEITHVPVSLPFKNAAGAVEYKELKGGYWPAIPDRTKSDNAQRRDDQATITRENNMMAFPTTGRGATKKRDANTALPLEFKLSRLPAHIDWAMRFTHIEPRVKDVGKILLHPVFREAMERIDPFMVSHIFTPWANRVARQKNDMAVTEEGWKQMNWLAGQLRTRTGLATMAGNIPNTLQQLTGFAPLARKNSFRAMGDAFLQYMRSPEEAILFINEKSPRMRFAMRLFEQDYLKQVQDILEHKNLWEKADDFTQKHGYIMQRYAQSLVNNVGWLAAYNNAMAGKVKGIAALDEVNAIRHADDTISSTQSFNEPENLTNIEAATKLGRLFTLFSRYFINDGNTLRTEAKAIAAGGGSKIDKAGKVFYLYLLAVLTPQLVGDLIRSGLVGDLPDDKDKDGTAVDDYLMYFVFSTLRWGSAHIPIAGAGFNYLLGKMEGRFDDRISVSPVLNMMEQGGRAPFSVTKAISGEGDSSRAVGDVMSLFGLLGLPTGFIKRPAMYIADVLEGDSPTPDGPLPALRGVVGGPAPKN